MPTPLSRWLWVSFLVLAGCGVSDLTIHDETFEDDESNVVEQGLVSCEQRGDTGYRGGRAFAISVISVDGRPVELETARAYVAMQQAAGRAGVGLRIVSGFRTMAEQQRLYACYTQCNCNNCNLAAVPGRSNHQSGSALDLNTSSGGVMGWLNANAGRFGFVRTVPSEPWHWEWNGSGPRADICGGGGGGGDCNASCGAFGCACVDGQCSGGFCPGTGCTEQETRNGAAFGTSCVDHRCEGGFAPGSGCTAKETVDCGKFGCACADHQCSGGYCPGTGCTAKETRDCAAFGTSCVDHQCSGGYAAGTGCTAKEARDCGSFGCGCVDHQCSGGFCPGTGCTARQTTDCAAQGRACRDGACR